MRREGERLRQFSAVHGFGGTGGTSSASTTSATVNKGQSARQRAQRRPVPEPAVSQMTARRRARQPRTRAGRYGGTTCPQFGHTRAAPCPAPSLRAAAGNAAERADGEEVAGRVRVKVGPVTASYAGAARFVAEDEAAHRFVLEGNGRETRGTGTASATVEVSMSEQDAVTRVRVVALLEVTGKQAQFGRGVLADIAAKLTGQFAACLAE